MERRPRASLEEGHFGRYRFVGEGLGSTQRPSTDDKGMGSIAYHRSSWKNHICSLKGKERDSHQ